MKQIRFNIIQFPVVSYELLNLIKRSMHNASLISYLLRNKFSIECNGTQIRRQKQ